MTDSTDPLVAAAVRPLTGDAEMNSSAVRLLESLREERPDQTEAALKRWHAPAREKRRMSWRVTLHLTALVISILLLTHATLDFLRHRRTLPAFSNGLEETADLFDSTRLSAHDKLLLKIGDGLQSPTELAKALWDSDPTNPAYFSEYCAAYISDQKKLPADFLEQARRIDPSNTYFPYWAAAVAAQDAVKRRSLSKAAKAAGAAPEWDVMDEGKVDQALAIVHESLNLPDCRNYEIQMIRERIPLLPQSTPLEYSRSISFLHMTTSSNLSMHLANALAAKAWLCGNRGDTQGIIALKQVVDVYLRNISCTEPGAIVEDLIIERGAMVTLKNLNESAVKLGLATEATEIQTRLDRLEKLASDRKAGVFEIEGKEASRQLGVNNDYSIVFIAKYALHPPVLTDRDVKPGRMREYDILSQVCTFGTWALLAFVAGLTALYRFRPPRVIRDLSARMELLLRPADWVWLCVVGIPPFIYCLLITRLTTLGGSGANIFAGAIQLPYDGVVLLPIAQFTGLFFMMLILLVLVARWRLGKRAAFFGFGKARLWPGAIAFVSAAASIPVLGWAVTEASDIALKISWGLFVIPMAWILAVLIRAMTAGAPHLLHLTTASRVLVPAYSAAMVILLMATPFHMMSRQRWFELDTMNHLDAAYPSLTKFEYQLSVAARQELREALGYEPMP